MNFHEYFKIIDNPRKSTELSYLMTCNQASSTVTGSYDDEKLKQKLKTKDTVLLAIRDCQQMHRDGTTCTALGIPCPLKDLVQYDGRPPRDTTITIEYC